MDRPTVALAATSVVLHAAAGIVSLLVMPGATPAMEPDAAARATYLADHVVAWRLAWLVWAGSGISFVLVLARLAPAPVVRLGGAATVVADLASQVVLAWVLPGTEGAAQARWEAIGWGGATMVANLGYTVVGAGAVWLAMRGGRIKAVTAWLSVPVWLAGLAVAVAHPLEWDQALVVATGVLTAAVTVWLAWVGVQASRS